MESKNKIKRVLVLAFESQFEWTLKMDVDAQIQGHILGRVLDRKMCLPTIKNVEIVIRVMLSVLPNSRRGMHLACNWFLHC